MSLYTIDKEKTSAWGMKYRPDTIDECILPQHIKDQIKGIIEGGDLPSMLFHSSSPGSGKSSLSLAIARELDADVLFLNASLDNSIDDVRNTVTRFCSSVSLEDKPKIVMMDECLSEDEHVRIGTLDSWKPMRLGDLERDCLYPVVSFNMETGEYENDSGYIISDREDELYEVELEDGSTVVLNAKHPFIVKSGDKFIEKTIEDGLSLGDSVVRFSDSIVNEVYTSKVKSIRKVGSGRVVNLTVQKNHTFLTESGIVTHNCDHMSQNAQAAIRGIIEQFQGVSFIFTCNYIHKIMPAIQSRCSVIEFKIPKEERQDLLKQFIRRVFEILDTEGVEYDPKVVVQFVTKYAPDYRKTLNELQRYSKGGPIDSGILSTVADVRVDGLINGLKAKDFSSVRRWIADNSGTDWTTFYGKLYDVLYDKVEPNCIPNIVLLLAKYQFQAGQVVDQTLNFSSFCIETMGEVSFK